MYTYSKGCRTGKIGQELPFIIYRIAAILIPRPYRRNPGEIGRNQMNTYQVKLERNEEIAEGTMAFHFEKPSTFSFKPGQAVDLVIKLPTGQNATHTFSLVSAPFENELIVATRMRDSAFKHALGSLPIGSYAEISGPTGSLTLHHDLARPGVFMAGGIGITPFMSILRQAAKDQLPHRLLLLFSNHRPEDAPFLAELQQLEVKNRYFRMIAMMTRMSASSRSWEGETRRINEALVQRAVHDLSTPIYYLAGPPNMVEALRDTLDYVGIDDDDIRSEEFYGY
jgi:ferredoxin-NADP reductase